jgi:phage/plasmid-like protein (TIGR03299 family)
MAHEIDGQGKNARAIYARKPAWHSLGTVKEDGWFTAEEALAVLNPNSEPVRKCDVYVRFVDGNGKEQFIPADEWSSTVRINPDTNEPQVLGVNGRDYGVVQLEEKFRFMDEVVGAIGGAHYETAGLLRRGKQSFLTIATEAIELDREGRSDPIARYILGVNSYDGSQAFRVKMTNVRVECANMLAMALRGSSGEVVSGDWSTRHTKDILNRVWAAQQTLGLYREYNDRWAADAEMMIHTEMSDGAFDRLLVGLFTSDRTGVEEVDRERIAEVRTIYELSPTCERIYGTFWGGLQAVTEHEDWHAKLRGGKKSTVQERRFMRQMDSSLKGDAWDLFRVKAEESRKVLVTV